MLSIRNQLICLSIAMLLVVCFQSNPASGQMKKKKLLKGLMGASLLKLFKTKKGFLPIPFALPLPMPIDWQTQAGLMSKNQAPTHVSHQPYAQGIQQGIQMSPIEYADYQNAIAQALSNGNTYIPSSYSAGNQAGTGYPSSSTSGQNDNSGYGSNSGDSSNNNGGQSSNGYDGSSDENSNNYNSGPASYGVNGVNQNDEYNAYQVSNNDNSQSSGSYRSAAASSLNPSYNMQFNGEQQSNYGNYANYAPNYNGQFNSEMNEYSQPAPQNNEQQFNSYQNQANGQSAGANNYEDNNGSASSNSFVATSSQQQQQNNYIPLRQVPVYNQAQSSSSGQPQMTSNGWVALD